MVGHEFTSRGDQPVEEWSGCIYGNDLQDAPGNIENRPVIDFKNLFPVFKHLILTDAAPFAPKFIKGTDVIEVAIPAGQAFMEHQRIGQDGHRHSPSLLSVLLPEFLANLLHCSRMS